MSSLLNVPAVFFGAAFFALALSAKAGCLLQKTFGELRQENRDDFAFVLTATLTLLGLIIGFAFSMSISRYDQRKIYEEDEANAIGTEYLRCGLLTGSEVVGVRTVLTQYLNQRIEFYETRDPNQLGSIDLRTDALQQRMWSVVQTLATSRPTVTLGLVVSGINDVINSRGYTEAAWLNRIPIAAWMLMTTIAICCNVLLGYGVRQRRTFLLVVLPLVIAIAFFLIAEIDSPRGGLIRVLPTNLLTLAHSLAA
jgi:hypothetical protein